jgi:hypothetical protein
VEGERATEASQEGKTHSTMLIEKYQWQLEDRFFEAQNQLDQPEPQCTEESRRTLMQHSMDQVPGVRQNAQVTDRSSSGNPDHRVNHPDVLRKREEPSWEQEQVKKHVVIVGSWLCMMSSKVHING